MSVGGISGIILAGGDSRRMGLDKAFIDVGGQSLVQRVADVVRAVCDELIIVTTRPSLFRDYEARVAPDLPVGKGVLRGLYSGLHAARHRYSLVVACDMPFLNRRLLEHMVARADGDDVVIPHLGGHFEPLHAVYSKTCLPAIDQLLSQQRLSVLDLYPVVQVRRIGRRAVVRFDPDLLSFMNVNTPDELARARRIASQGAVLRTGDASQSEPQSLPVEPPQTMAR